MLNACYTYVIHLIKEFIFVPHHEMKHSFRIFFLVTLLTAKFTLSFFGQSERGHSEFEASFSKSSHTSLQLEAICCTDENETRVEGDDDTDENEYDLQCENKFVAWSHGQRYQSSIFANLDFLSSESLFILYRNFRL